MNDQQPLVVRDLQRSDLSELRSLYRVTWRHTYSEAFGPPVAERMVNSLDTEDLAGLLPGSGEKAIVCHSGGSLVGAAIFRSNGAVTYLWGFYIRPDQQRRGLGSRLFLEVVSRLGPTPVIEVRAVQCQASAIAYWAKVGFTVVGTEDCCIGDHVTMATFVMRNRVGSARMADGARAYPPYNISDCAV